MPSDATTIKVPKPLRDRIAENAGHEGLSSQAFLESLVDTYERTRRLAAVAAAYRGSDVDDLESWRSETAEWDTLANDGLDE
jgi:hypothetical protein